MTTLLPMPMKAKEMIKSITIWFATLNPATALSLIWLTMKKSTVPIITRRPCSIKIGQANAKSATLTAGEGDGDCGSAPERPVGLGPLMTRRPDLSDYQSAPGDDSE